VGGGDKATPEQEVQLRELTIAVNNNIALCHLKEENYEKVRKNGPG
jgi:hypothetical protein